MFSYLLALVVTTVELFSSALALHDGVHGLQVRRVGTHSQADVLVRHAVQALDVCSQVVLYVTGALCTKGIINKCNYYIIYLTKQ